MADTLPLEHMLLQLKRSPEQEKALQNFIDELHTKGSPNFHRWLSAQEFGERFGLALEDLKAVTAWLESHGFRVNVVYASGMLVDFSGTAGQVRVTFQTEIHHIDVKGERHIANMTAPRIPAALAPVIAGVVSLHDFRPHVLHRPHKTKPEFTFTDFLGGINYAVVPADLATIYNLNSVFSSGISGQGQTIVLIEDTDVFSASDWSTFRSTFGLDGYGSASFAQINPPAPPSQPGNNCGAPGVIAPNDTEAILDAEWASAAAPSAAIVMAACAQLDYSPGWQRVEHYQHHSAKRFNGTVSLSASALPSGVTASFNPTSTTSASTMTFTASSTTAVGTATVTITATSGGLTRQTQFTLTVNPAPSFALSPSPSALSVAQGNQGFSPINGLVNTPFGIKPKDLHRVTGNLPLILCLR